MSHALLSLASSVFPTVKRHKGSYNQYHPQYSTVQSFLLPVFRYIFELEFFDLGRGTTHLRTGLLYLAASTVPLFYYGVLDEKSSFSGRPLEPLFINLPIVIRACRYGSTSLGDPSIRCWELLLVLIKWNQIARRLSWILLT